MLRRSVSDIILWRHPKALMYNVLYICHMSTFIYSAAVYCSLVVTSDGGQWWDKIKLLYFKAIYWEWFFSFLYLQFEHPPTNKIIPTSYTIYETKNLKVINNKIKQTLICFFIYIVTACLQALLWDITSLCLYAADNHVYRLPVEFVRDCDVTEAFQFNIK